MARFSRSLRKVGDYVDAKTVSAIVALRSAIAGLVAPGSGNSPALTALHSSTYAALVAFYETFLNVPPAK